MKNSNSLRYRSLLLRGATALAISSLLLYGTGCRGGEDTGTEVIQPTTTTEVMTTCTTFTSTNSTMSSTTTTTETETTATTTMAETISMTQPITESQTIAVMTEETPTETEIIIESKPIIEETSTYPITEYERILLCNIVANEAGSNWISIYDKASVVACVINRVNNPNFPDTIEGVLTQPYQFSGYYASGSYYPTVTDACIQAVDYYFNNPNEFGNWLYFEGDGTNNYFH